MNLPHAVIIAGGRGIRLGGVRKAELRLGGQRLIDRVADSLGAIEAPLLIATGSQQSARPLRADSVAVRDLVGPVGGPLAGLAAAVAALHAQEIRAGLLVSVAVDTPLLPEDFVPRLTCALGNRQAAFASWGEQFYPPNAIWRLDALADLPLAVQENRAPASLKALLRAMGGVRVDWFAENVPNPFINLNTLEDLITLARREQSGLSGRVIHKTVI